MALHIPGQGIDDLVRRADEAMTYHSKRGYTEYYEGILHGAAEYFHEPVTITVTTESPNTARAEIVFPTGRRPKALAA